MGFGKKNSAAGGSGEAAGSRQIIRAGRPICVAGFAAVLTAAAGPAFAQGVVGGCSNGVCIQDDPGASYVAGSGAADYTTGGPGTLSNAVNYANKNPGTKIILETDVKLNGPLEVLLNSMTIDGQGHTIDGNKSQRIFMVGVDNVTLLNPVAGQPNLAPQQDVTISNVTLKDGFAKGGDGAGGGGGMGAGGALFVNQTGNVTLSNVNFDGNGAKGGNGGAAGGVGAGGGGGMGGNGGANWGGGGGIYGNGGAGVGVKGGGRGGGGGLIGDGGDSQFVNNGLVIGSGGGPNGGAPGGLFNPDGGDGGFASGGGGGVRGGNSFFGGGGGGGNPGIQGEGGGSGFGGGGGGGWGGTSVFGGGGGGAGADQAGLSGFGGGAGGVGNAPLAGGGGAGIGGSVFVVDGGKLSIAGSATGNAETNSSVAKGVGGNVGVNDGQAYTNGFFIQGGTTLNFTGGKFTVSGQVADLNGVSGNTNTNNGVYGAGGIGKVLSTGGAYATLMIDNLYTGGSTIDSLSRIDVGANGSLGSGDLLMKDTSTLGFVNNNLMISNDAVFEGDAAVHVQSGFTETLASKIVDGSTSGRLVKTGDGKLIVTGENTTTGGARLDAGILNIDVGTVKNAGGGIVSSGVGTGTLTFNGGTLQAGRNVEIANAGALNNAGGAFDANGQILTYSGNLTDGDGVNGQIKIVDSSGFNGKVIFNGDNSYNGETVVGDGLNLVTLEAGKDNTFSPTSKMTVKLAGTVDLAGFNETVSSLNGEGVVTNTGARDGVLTNQGASSEFKGQITDGPTNKTGLIQNQIGETLTLSGDSTYTGGTKISGGAIQVGVQTVGGPGAITSSALGKGTLTFDSGTLRAGGNFTVANATTIDNTGGTVDANGKTFTLSGGITNGNGNTGVLNIFDKSTNGGGTVVLTNTNTYTGNTVVGDGTKAVSFKGGTANTFSTNSQTTVNEKATLDLGSVAQTINDVRLNKGTLTSGALTGAVTSDSGFVNKLSGTATVVANTGTTTVSVTNDYSGDTTIKGGATLLGANDNALSQGSKTTVEANGTLDLGNFSQKVNSVILTSGTLTNGALAGAVTSDSGLINKLSGTATVTANTGTTTLSVSSSYTGDTTIKTGATLTGLTNNTLSKGSKTIVETNGTLQLNSRLQTVDNVTLARGLITTGTLTSTNGVTSDGGTINNLTINGGATSLTTTSGTTILTGTNSFKGDVINDADLINRGTTTDALINRRRFTNDPGAIYNADINNSTANGVVTNNGTINGNLTNRLNATATNNAQWNGDITNEATATVLNAVGATLDGTLTNSGIATNNGTIEKGVVNNAGVTFTTTGVIRGAR